MEESVLLGTKPLVDSIRHFIRDPSGVFSVCHFCECRIVQWRHDSCLLLLLNWFLHIIKRTVHASSKTKFYVLVARTISLSFASLTREILFLSLEHKIHIFSPPCNILYISSLSIGSTLLTRSTAKMAYSICRLLKVDCHLKLLVIFSSFQEDMCGTVLFND